jgi:hypothetical protein
VNAKRVGSLICRTCYYARNLNGGATRPSRRFTSANNKLWDRRCSVTQSEIEGELRALRSILEGTISEAQSRDKEWRRLGLISSVAGILVGCVGAGFVIASVAIARTNASPNFHDQLVMMGITLVVLNIPLMLLGLALRTTMRQKSEPKQ